MTILLIIIWGIASLLVVANVASAEVSAYIGAVGIILAASLLTWGIRARRVITLTVGIVLSLMVLCGSLFYAPQGVRNIISWLGGDGDRVTTREEAAADCVRMSLSLTGYNPATGDYVCGQDVVKQDPTPMPPVQPTAFPKIESDNVGVTGHCDVLAVSSLPERGDAYINGTRVTLQVRDTNQCGRPLWYNESGVGQGANYTFDLPVGWVAVTASVSAEVHEQGGSPVQYGGGPVVVIVGPWVGSVGLYEGAVRIYPVEWVEDALNSEVIPIQRIQVGDPNLEPIYLDPITLGGE